MIVVDASRASVVVQCTDHPWWSKMARDRAHGWSLGRQHEHAEHPSADQSRVNLFKLQRHADDRA